MKVEFIELKSYLEHKEQNIFIKGFWYSIIISVLLILVILFSSCKKKNLYYENILFVENNAVFLTVNYNDFELINNNHKLIINNELYNYSIKNTSVINNGNLYYQFEISINEQFFDIDNGIFKYKILLQEESILKYLVRIVKGV